MDDFGFVIFFMAFTVVLLLLGALVVGFLNLVRKNDKGRCRRNNDNSTPS